MARLLELDSEEHRSLAVPPGLAVRFAATQHILPLKAIEIGKAASSMPVFLNRNVHTGAWALSAMTSFDAGASLFAVDGAWQATHKPLFLETYPLFLMQSPRDANGFVLGIAEGAVDSAAEGDRLFDDVLFEERRISAFGEFQPRGGLILGMWMSYGDQIDFANTRLGEQTVLEPFVNWNVNRNLLVRYEGAFVKLDSKDGPNIFDAAVHDVRLTWQFNVRSFLRLTTQFQDVERNLAQYIDDDVDARSKDVGRQLLYSYKINPQTVFFLGYSDQLIDEDAIDGLTASDRTWFMKIGYAFTP